MGKFLVIAGMNAGIDFVAFNALIGLFGSGIGTGRGAITLAIYGGVAFLAATVNSFIWNKLWVFDEPDLERGAIRQEFRSFFMISVLATVLNRAISYAFTFGLIGILVELGIQFYGYKMIVFGKGFYKIFSKPMVTARPQH